jgi:hypothetical protein
MNPTALVPLVALLGFIVLAIMVARQSLRKRINQLFLWYALLLMAWSFGSFMMHANFPIMSTYFWNSFLIVPLMFASVAFFHFVRAFLNKPEPRL